MKTPELILPFAIVGHRLDFGANTREEEAPGARWRIRP